MKLARFTTGDKVLVVAAFLALISLFVPWYQASISGVTIQSVSGWGTGYGWMAALLLVAAGIYVVLQRSDVELPKAPVRSAVVVLVLTKLGTFLVLVRLVTLPSANDGNGLGSVNYGPAAGILLALIAGVIETVCAWQMFRRRKPTDAAITAPMPEDGGAGLAMQDERG